MSTRSLEIILSHPLLKFTLNLTNRIEHIKKSQKKKDAAIKNGKEKVKGAVQTIADNLPTVGGDGDSGDEELGGEDDGHNWRRDIVEGRSNPKKSDGKDESGAKANGAPNGGTENATAQTPSGEAGAKGDAGQRSEVNGTKGSPVPGAIEGEAIPNPGESVAPKLTA